MFTKPSDPHCSAPVRALEPPVGVWQRVASGMFCVQDPETPGCRYLALAEETHQGSEVVVVSPRLSCSGTAFGLREPVALTRL